MAAKETVTMSTAAKADVNWDWKRVIYRSPLRGVLLIDKSRLGVIRFIVNR